MSRVGEEGEGGGLLVVGDDLGLEAVADVVAPGVPGARRGGEQLAQQRALVGRGWVGAQGGAGG